MLLDIFHKSLKDKTTIDQKVKMHPHTFLFYDTLTIE